MDNTSLSPEEKLLRLIKGDKIKKDALHRNDKAAHENSYEINHLRSNIGKQYKHLTLGAIENIIIATLMISLGYLAASYLYPIFGSKEIKIEVLALDNPSLEKPQNVQDNKPLEWYLEAVKQRPIFKSASLGAGQQMSLAVTSDINKDFVLVGIITGQSPQAIIEDRKAGKTYYIAKGQFLGQYLLEDILDGKIILKINGQSFELSI